MNEALVGTTGSTYPNLPQVLVHSGLIKAHAYSLWLDDRHSSTGTILFGGVDAAKYHGTLKTVPIQPINGQYAQFVIALTSVSMNAGSSKHRLAASSFPIGVLLDSGTSLTYLPPQVVTTIYNKLGAVYDGARGIAFAPCSLVNQKIHFSFTFSAAQVHVSITDLIRRWGGLQFQNGKHACAFGIVPSTSGSFVLGDTFLRSADVVFDMDNNEISLANAKYNPSSNNILEIGTGTNAVPGATRVPNPVTTVKPINPTGTVPTSVIAGDDSRSGSGTFSRERSSWRKLLFVPLLLVLLPFYNS